MECRLLDDFYEVPRPKVNLEKIDTYREIPSKVVPQMSGDDFEQYITEWLYTANPGKIYHTGKSHDKGIDHIIQRKDDELEYIQCKREKTPSYNFPAEVLKVLNNIRRGDVPMPVRYKFVAINGVPSQWYEFLQKGKMKDSLLKKYRESSFFEKEDYEGFENWMIGTDLPEIELIDMNQVYNEHLNGPYGFLRFGNEIGLKRKEPPRENENEMHYVEEILKAYSEHRGKPISVDDLKDDEELKEDLDRQKSSFYSAESLRITVDEYLMAEKEFEKLKDEIYEGIIES